MVEAVIWLVLWVLFAVVGAWLLVALSILAGAGIAMAAERVWVAPLGAAIGWLLGATWGIFAAIQAILQVISVIQLASA